MPQLSLERRRELDGKLPAASLDYLQNVGLPESLCFQGQHYLFDLLLPEMNDGEYFQVADVDQGFFFVALKCIVGHVWYFAPGMSGSEWAFSNSSIEQFIDCVAATERLWELEQTGQIPWEDRWKFLDHEIRKIDPATLDDSDGLWQTMIEEIRAGVI